MKILVIVLWLCAGAMPAFAAENGSSNNGNHYGENRNGNNGNGEDHRGAPAPLVGFGLPAVLAVGGALLGAKLLNRKR